MAAGNARCRLRAPARRICSRHSHIHQWRRGTQHSRVSGQDSATVSYVLDYAAQSELQQLLPLPFTPLPPCRDLQQCAKPLLISAVGDDGAAQQLVQHCESVGIDVSGVTRHPGCRTACISITYDKGVAAACPMRHSGSLSKVPPGAFGSGLNAVHALQC